jgi:hypothetical protein
LPDIGYIGIARYQMTVQELVCDISKEQIGINIPTFMELRCRRL